MTLGGCVSAPVPAPVVKLPTVTPGGPVPAPVVREGDSSVVVAGKMASGLRTANRRLASWENFFAVIRRAYDGASR